MGSRVYLAVENAHRMLDRSEAIAVRCGERDELREAGGEHPSNAGFVARHRRRTVQHRLCGDVPIAARCRSRKRTGRGIPGVAQRVLHLDEGFEELEGHGTAMTLHQQGANVDEEPAVHNDYYRTET